MDDVQKVESQIVELMKGGPFYFFDVLDKLRDADYRTILLAWAALREKGRLDRIVETGEYVIKN
ncbi:MAG: hypothetical protein ACE5LX_03065 [Nitrospinota bacterium]